MTGPSEVSTVRDVARRLDHTQNLLQAAVQHLTTLEHRLQRHEYAITDLHRDAAKIVTAPAVACDASSPIALGTVRDGADELIQDLRVSGVAATTSHTLLTSAGHQVGIARLLLEDLAAANGAPGAGAGGVAGEISYLSARTVRLSTLVEAATPIASRTQHQLTAAREILDTHVSQLSQARQSGVDTGADIDRMRRCLAIDHGIFDSSQAIARARGTTTDISWLVADATTPARPPAAAVIALDPGIDLGRPSRPTPVDDPRRPSLSLVPPTRPVPRPAPTAPGPTTPAGPSI